MRRLSAPTTNHVWKLILGNVRLHRRYLGYLMPPRLSFRRRLGGCLRQASTAMSAFLRQQYFDGAHLRHGNQVSMMARVPRLTTRLPLALVLAAARPLLAGQSIGRGWLGGVGRVLLPPGQLPLQICDLFLGICDLFLGIRDLLFAFGYLTAEILVLSQQSLNLLLQLFSAGLVGVPMTIRCYTLLPRAASRSRTHTPYSKRSGWNCPEKSTEVPELLLLDQQPQHSFPILRLRGGSMPQSRQIHRES